MRKRLEALQVYRDGDEHVVEHHHTSHPIETHKFKGRNQAAGHILGAMARLAAPEGLPEEQEGSEPDSLMGGKPASFDYGSTREGEIQGRRK
jgi:hypothetical protein